MEILQDEAEQCSNMYADEDMHAREQIEGKIHPETLDKTYLVEAGAGTGKTTLMISRIIQLLLQNKAHLSEIVAITFTDKAAQELKIRLKNKLEQMLQEEQSKSYIAFCQNALWELEHASISTIHSFCTKLLQSKPIEASIDPNFEVVHDFTQTLFYDKNWDDWIEQQINNKAPMLRQMLRFGIEIRTIKNIAHALLEHQELLKNASIWKTTEELPYWDLFSKIVNRFREMIPDCNKIEDEGYKQFSNIIQDYEHASILTKEDRERYIIIHCTQLKPKGNKKNWKKPEYLTEIKEELIPQYNEMLDIFLQNIRDNLFRWLQNFVCYYQNNKQYKNMLTFDDLLIYTRNLLQYNKEVRAEFQRQYKYILVDEFQDTDPLQTEILFFLAEQDAVADTWDKVQLQPGKLFIVGDPKQSIYRFRKADIEIYEAVKNALGSEHFLAITKNFRSNSSIIDWVNFAFSSLIVAPCDGQTYQPNYIPLIAQHKNLNNEPTVISICSEVQNVQEDESFLEINGDIEEKEDSAEKITIDKIIQEEANNIAYTMHLMVSNQWMIGNPPRAIQYNDMALLLYRFSKIETFERAFAKYNIPYKVVGSKFYYSREEVTSISNLLQALEEPFNAIAVVATLRSPIFNISDVDIFRYKETYGTLDYRVSNTDDSLVSKTFSILRELHQKIAHSTLSSLLEEIYQKTGMFFIFLSMSRGEQRIGNLLKIKDKSYQFSQKQGENIHAFIEWLKHMISQEEDEQESDQINVQGISILSIHKSKGLEFPAVFLGDLNANPNAGNSQSIKLFYNKQEDQISFSCPGTFFTFSMQDENVELEEKKAEAEAIRLLYVATTRAKDYLIIPTSADAKSSGLYKILKNYLHEDNYIKNIIIPNEADNTEDTKKIDFQMNNENIMTIQQNREIWKQKHFYNTDIMQDKYIELHKNINQENVLHLFRQVISYIPLSITSLPYQQKENMLHNVIKIYNQKILLSSALINQCYSLIECFLNSKLWKQMQQIPYEKNISFHTIYKNKVIHDTIDLFLWYKTQNTILFYSLNEKPTEENISIYNTVLKQYKDMLMTIIPESSIPTKIGFYFILSDDFIFLE